jgi:hypothetical protein
MINYTDLKAPPQRTLKLTSDTIQISAFDPFESQRAPLPAPAAQVSLSGNASFEPEDLIDQVVILKEGQTPPPGKIAVYLRKRPQTYSQLPKPYSVPVTTYPEQIDDHRYALKKVKEALFKEEVKRVEDEEYGQTEEAQRYLKTLRGNVQFLQQTLDSVLRLRQEATLTRATELLDLEAAPESKRGKIDSEEQLEDHTSVYLRFINQQY